MSRTLILLTGASRGFGRSVAVSFAKSPLSQTHPTDFLLTARDTVLLDETATQVSSHSSSSSSSSNTIVTHVLDFNDSTTDLDAHCENLLSRIPHPPSSYSRVYLINNAGSLGRLDRLKDQRTEDVAPAIHLNLTAPTVLTSAFLRHFAPPSPSPSSTPTITIVNVSSLAALQPFDCWGIYCSVKAARDMYHRTIAIEDPSVRVLNYAPGPMDTDMQTRIRKEMPDVPLRDVYDQMHREDKLVRPDTSARVLLRLLERDEWVNADHVDIYDVPGWDQ
ncbi:hypothetical protein HKX48_003558 [Thoreauomyces humboldtii]|nr:hypothetical protein HKX48_003558 [Thoreauomyces humboldtii]